MKKLITPKIMIRVVSAIVVLVVIGIAIALQMAPKADTLVTVISNKASVSYQSNNATVSKTSNTVTTTLEPTIPSPAVPTPTPTTPVAARIFTSVEGVRSTLQRFKLSAFTAEKVVVTLVFDYYPKDKPLPSSDAVIKTSRRLQLNSGTGFSHTIDQSGNANQYVVGYFEAKVGSQVRERSGYYYIDTAIGSTLSPLP